MKKKQRKKKVPRRVTQVTTPRRILVHNIDPGNGRRIDVWIQISGTGLEVRKYGSYKTRWFVPLRAAAEAIARAGQVREIRLRMGRPLEAEGDAGPLFGGNS